MTSASTHELVFADSTVTKRYRRWENGEHRREWDALVLVHSHRPDLVPEPLSAALDDDPPSIVMSRLPGRPLDASPAGSPVSPVCLDAVAAAVDGFHRAIPSRELSSLPVRRWDAPSFTSRLRDWAAQSTADARLSTYEHDVATALRQASAWIASFDRPTGAAHDRNAWVFGRADGNMANLLWDGERVRLVDFEDAGVSDVAYELADLAEHLSTWTIPRLESEDLLDRFSLPAVDRERLREYRRLFALFWLLMLLPGHPGHARNPAGTLERQAARLLALL